MRIAMQRPFMTGVMAVSIVLAAAGAVRSNDGFVLRHVVEVDAPGQGGVTPGLSREEAVEMKRTESEPKTGGDSGTPAIDVPLGFDGGSTEPANNGGMGGSGRSAEP